MKVPDQLLGRVSHIAMDQQEQTNPGQQNEKTFGRLKYGNPTQANSRVQ